MISDDDRLRRAFAAGSERAAGDCPAPDLLWAAAAGELPPAERRAVIDHTSRCAACAEDFRLVAEMARQAPSAAAPAPGRLIAGPWATRERRWLIGSLAATLLIGVLVAGLWRNLRGPEIERGGEAEIVSLLGAQPLFRENAVLRWQGPPGARYAVTVTTRDLRLVDEARDLEQSSHRIPPEKLAGLAPGTPLDWRVEALLPDGRRLSSPLFTFLLGP